MATKTVPQPSLLDRFKAFLKQDSKASRQYSILDQTGDVLSDTFRRIFLVVGILIISAFLGAIMPALLGTPNGPADLIAIIYAESCATSGICDLPTLHTGFAIAVIAFSGFTLALIAAFRGETNGRIYERFEDVLDTLERLETYSMPADELPESYLQKITGE